MNCNRYSLENLSDQYWREIFGILMAIISFAATVENALVLLTLHKYKELHTPSNKILASLAVTDFLTGITIALLFSLQLLNDQLTQQCVIELVRRYLSSLLVGASVLTIGFISYDRYTNMTKLKYRMQKRKLRIGIFICWAIPALLPFLRFMTKSESVYSGIIVVIDVFILMIISMCYAIIIYTLHNNNKTIAAYGDMANHIKRMESERKAAKAVLTIITFFVVMIIPICVHLALALSKKFNKDFLAKSYIIGMTLCILNSAVNPIIYYAKTPQLRRRFLNLVKLRQASIRRAFSRETEMTVRSYDNKIVQ